MGGIDGDGMLMGVRVTRVDDGSRMGILMVKGCGWWGVEYSWG